MDTPSKTGNTAAQLARPTLWREQCYVNGKWIGGAETIEVNNPSSGEIIARVPKFGRKETEDAINAANAALPEWRARTGKNRAAILRKWSDLMLAHTVDLGRIITLEQGKPKAEAEGEIAYAASFLEWFAEEARRVDGEVLQSPNAAHQMLAVKEAIGVCAAITPWNFPAAMITRKVGPALAAGCSIVVKPAEATPLTAFALAVLAEEAGVPAGVFNVVTGDPKPIGQALCESNIVRKLSFTGSTGVGRTLMAQCAPTIKKLSLELGGNSPFIVFEDADLDRALDGIMAAKFRNSGQTCVCANRIYVQRSIYEKVAEKLTARVAAMKVGDGATEGVTQGPLINPAAIDKVERHVSDATAKGARITVGGKRHALGGTFFEPTVVRDVTRDMLFAEEETFGPVAPLFAFDTEEEAIKAANDTIFGLAAYMYSTNHARIYRVSRALEYGMVGVNTGLISNEVAPFGGVKQSGLGREGSHHGIDEYLELKYICVDISG